MTAQTVARHVDCHGVFNLRDLGGYPVADGRQVRWRTLYRGDGLHRVPVDARGALHDLRWRTVLDLRTLDEVETGRYACDGVEEIHLPLLQKTWDRSDLSDDVDATAPFLVGRYLAMVERGATVIAAAFEILASPARLPAVFHCAAGKDRTGVLAALVLATLGVTDEVVAQDYHLSAPGMARLVDWVTTQHPDYGAAMAGQPPSFLACPPEAIVGFLDALRCRYGSTDQYLQAIGIPRATLQRLRDALLVG